MAAALALISSVLCSTASISSRRTHFPSPTFFFSRSSVTRLNFSSVPASLKSSRHWRPMCLYYTQDKCTQMNNPLHTEKFNHDYSIDLKVDASEVEHLNPQIMEYFLVLDLEGKVEILEFPVVMIDARTMDFVDSFHRFVRPTKMTESRINSYIKGKYGELGIDRVWHDTAIPFTNVLKEFEFWLEKHKLWKTSHGGMLHRAAFVTCGNWDLKTKVPEQCVVSRIKTPKYFMEWINLKDIYLNFYQRKATGMMTMMKQLGIPLLGSHHLGIDDAKNIVRVLQRMLADGAVLQITGRKGSTSKGDAPSGNMHQNSTRSFSNIFLGR